MRKIIFVFSLFLILFFDSNVYAICDDADIERLKGIAENVQITYEHNVYGNKDDMLVSIYDMFMTGVTDEIYVVDDFGNEYHHFDKNYDGNILFRSSAGERKFFIYSNYCIGTLLYTKKLTLPTFNFNSLSEECQKEEFKDLDICAEFLVDDKEQISGDEFEKVIEEVKKEREGILYKVFDFIKSNLLYMSIGIGVIVIVAIVLIIRYHRRNVLE